MVISPWREDSPINSTVFPLMSFWSQAHMAFKWQSLRCQSWLIYNFRLSGNCGKKWNVLRWPSPSPDLNPMELHFTCWRTTEGKMPQEASGSEDSGSRGLVEHHQGWNPASGDVSRFQTSGCHWLQRICNQVLKLIITLMIMLVCPITFDPLKRRIHI